jgi:hypothetical protein
VTFYVFCRLRPPKTYMYSSELHRGVNDLISISARRILVYSGTQRAHDKYFVFFCVAEVNGAERRLAGEPFLLHS